MRLLDAIRARVAFVAAANALFAIGAGPAFAASEIAEEMQAGRHPVAQVFTILFLMLGPFKLVGPFLKGTKGAGLASLRKAALLATVFATIALLIAGLLGETLLANYGISLDVLRLASGLILFLVAIRTVLEQFAAPEPPAAEVALEGQAVMKLAMRPLAFPGIVTPYGIAALVVFLAFSQSVESRLTIAAVVLAVMVLNLVFMLAARRLQVVFGLVLPVLGAVLGVVQVALGLQIMNVALRAARDLAAGDDQKKDNRMTLRANKSTNKQSFDHEILVLQGGGALGAYHAGVFEGLVEAHRSPSWVVGVSIGAITSALIAGNPPEKRVERLRAFWERVSAYAPFIWPSALEAMRPAYNALSAGVVATFGSPGFFTPRVPPPFFLMGGGPEATSFYDTGPLRATLEELVDFDRINHGDVRISLGANVRTGASVYFDNRRMRVGPEHVMASGALPPGFPAVEIDGEHYWDGGIVSNTPLSYVWDEKPLTTALIVQVDLFKPIGALPTNIDEVLERHKDIQYASKQRFSVDHVKQIGQLRGALIRLLDKLPPRLRTDPDAKRLASICDDREWAVVRLVNERLAHVSQTKDYEFSRVTVDEDWSAGLDDVRRAIANRDAMTPTRLIPGVTVYELATKDEASMRVHA